jgi:hypothetical protein
MKLITTIATAFALTLPSVCEAGFKEGISRTSKSHELRLSAISRDPAGGPSGGGDKGGGGKKQA